MKNITIYLTDRDFITEDDFNDLVGDHWKSGETVTRAVFNKKCVDYMNGSWITSTPVHKTIICKCCGEEHEELVRFKHKSINMNKTSGRLFIYDTDFGTVQLVEE